MERRVCASLLHVFSGPYQSILRHSWVLIINFPPLHSRSRKIRCDGGKPTCTNCIKRSASKPHGDEIECSYDAIPKRRGPDRNPGARQRTIRKKKPVPEQPPTDSSLLTNSVSAGGISLNPATTANQLTELTRHPGVDDLGGEVSSLPSGPQQVGSQLTFGMPSAAQSGPSFLHPILHSHQPLPESYPDPNQPHVDPPSTSANQLFTTLPPATSTTTTDSLLGKKRKTRDDDDDERDFPTAPFHSATTRATTPAPIGLEQNARQGAVELRNAMATLRLSSTTADVGKFGLSQRDGKFHATDFDIGPDLLADHHAAFYATGTTSTDLAHGTMPPTFDSMVPSSLTHAFNSEYEVQITPEPPLQYSRQTWWDNLLNTYSSDKETSWVPSHIMPVTLSHQAPTYHFSYSDSAKQISEDLRSL